MARSRDIRPEFFTDEKVGELPYGARLLYIGIWCHSDFRGVFEYTAKQMRALVFPFDEGLTGVTVQEWLNALESQGMIGRFEAGGKPWGFIRKWSAHQVISRREKDIGTKRPPPPVPCEVPGVFPGTPQAHPRNAPGASQVVPGDVSPSPSPSPAPAPAPSPALAPPGSCTLAELDDPLGMVPLAQSPTSPPPRNDDDLWRFEVGNMSWARALVAIGAKVGPRNWRAWMALVDQYGIDAVSSAAKGIDAEVRWADRTETALAKSRGQLPIAEALKASGRKPVVLQ